MSGRTRTWWIRAGVAIGAALLVAASVRLWWLRPGDVDPVSAICGLAGIVAAAFSVWQAQRLADGDVEAASKLLAERVMEQEKAQRAQLLGRRGRDAVIDVDFTLVAAGGSASAPGQGSLKRVAGYFRGMRPPRRLAITGAAGSGKTVLAIELILELLLDLRPGDPIPVRISAASLDPDVPVREMLARHLITAYDLRPAAARTLVAAERILPVVDGLDEMDETGRPGYRSRAARALRALEDYEHGLDRCSLVVTCRDEQYDALVADRAAPYGVARVRVGEVTGDKAWRFIQAVTDQRDPERWQPVLDALTTDDHVLARALDTPWQLTLAVSGYEERDPRTGRYVRSPRELTEFPDERSVREHLLGLFIPARLAAADPARKGPDPERTHAWLALLASHLRGSGDRPPGTDLVLHRLWSLAGDRARVFAALLTLLACLPGIAAFTAVAALLISQTEIVDGKISGRVVGAGMLLWLPGVMAFYMLGEPFRTWRNAPDPGWSPAADPRTGSRVVQIGFSAVMGWLMGTALFMMDFYIDFPAWLPPAFALLFGVGVAILERRPRQIADPRAPIRQGAASLILNGLALGLVFAVVCGLMLAGLLEGLPIGVSLAGCVLFGLSATAISSSELFHYAGLLLATRGRLPFRLGHFLHQCYELGLLRISGIAYQFRHRELQDYLATHPVPSSGRRQGRGFA